MAMFYYCVDGELHGIIGCHIDDFLHAGTVVFVIDEVMRRFTVGRKEGEFSYINTKQEIINF